MGKILILGANGLLGRALTLELAAEEPIAWDKENLDLTDFEELRCKIIDLWPEIIINASGYTAVDTAENNKEVAELMNGRVVDELARVAKEIGAVMVHFSTDYVFDGEAEGGYDEDAIPSPINLYGRSKALGEKLLLESGARYYLIRSAWLFGDNGENFVKTILRVARDKGELKVVNDQYGKPTYAKDLARATAELLRQKPEYGVYHLCNEGVTTWYDLASRVVELMGIRAEVRPCASDEFPRAAKRPARAYLNNTRWQKLRPWQEALAEYLKV